MAEPDVVVRQDEDTGEQEDGFGELDDGEAPQVLRVQDVAGYAEGGEGPGEAVDEGEQELDGDDGVDEAVESLFRQDGVLFYQFGEVVEAGGWERRG